MKLLSVYSSSSGLKVSKPHILENFYPVIHEKYITLQAGSSAGVKNYDYWLEVILLIKKYLDANRIGIILIGSDKDAPLPHTHDLRGRTTLNQSAYIVKRALLHAGNDSCWAHIAAAYGVPLVSLYGPTSSQNHGPYWFEEEKTILIDSHRRGKKPSFAYQEFPKSINFIPPEVVASSILKLLGINEDLGVNSLYMGPIYNNHLIEYIPNQPYPHNLAPESPIIVRMDYHFDENNLRDAATKRSLHIVSNREMNIDLLKQIKPKILGLNFELSMETSLEFLNNLKSLGIKTLFYTKSEDENYLNELRFKFFDIGFVEKMNTHRKENFLNDSKEYTNDFSLDLEKKIGSMEYKSNKFLISDGKVFLSKVAWKKDIPAKSFAENFQPVIDDPDFWDEMEHFYIYERK